jgi:hypothetical protein
VIWWQRPWLFCVCSVHRWGPLSEFAYSVPHCVSRWDVLRWCVMSVVFFLVVRRVVR